MATGIWLLRVSGFLGGYGLVDVRGRALSTFGRRFWRHAGGVALGVVVVALGVVVGGESGGWEGNNRHGTRTSHKVTGDT